MFVTLCHFVASWIWIAIRSRIDATVQHSSSEYRLQYSSVCCNSLSLLASISAGLFEAFEGFPPFSPPRPFTFEPLCIGNNIVPNFVCLGCSFIHDWFIHRANPLKLLAVSFAINLFSLYQTLLFRVVQNISCFLKMTYSTVDSIGGEFVSCFTRATSSWA